MITTPNAIKQRALLLDLLPVGVPVRSYILSSNLGGAPSTLRTRLAELRELGHNITLKYGREGAVYYTRTK